MTVIHRERKEEIALGMTLLGLVFSSLLYGVTITQTYKYYKRFPGDQVFIKILVASVCILDTVSVFLVTHACWYYLVTTQPIGVAVWSLNVELAISMFISGIAESFLAYRVWMFSDKSYRLTSIIMLLALLHFTSGEVSAVEFLILRRFAHFQSVKVPSILRLGSAAFCDTSIAVALCYYLQKRRTGYKRTDQIIDKLIAIAVHTGLVTSISSIACLVTYLTVPRTWVYLALCFLISRLYSNTFLSTLNSRQVLRDADNEPDSGPVPQFHSLRRPRFLKRSNSEKPTTQIDVYVVTETITDGCLNNAGSSAGSTSSQESVNLPDVSHSTVVNDSGSDLKP